LYAPLQRIVELWPALAAKLAADVDAKVPQASGLYSQLVDLELFLAARAMLPLLGALNTFVKACQQRHVFIGDLSKGVAALKDSVLSMYTGNSAFKGVQFKAWTTLLDIGKAGSILSWDDDERLILVIDGEPFGLTAVAPKTGRAGRPATTVTSVDAALFSGTLQSVRSTMSAAARSVVRELNERYPTSANMDAMAVVYAEFWLDSDISDAFTERLQQLIRIYCDPIEHKGGSSCCVQQSAALQTETTETLTRSFLVWLAGNTLSSALCRETLLQQAGFFKEAAITAAKAALAKHESDVLDAEHEGAALSTLMWRHLTKSPILAAMISEFIKLGELVLVMVPGSVEEERTFSTMGFIKNELRNRLGEEHLNSAVSMFSQKHFSLQSFPFDRAVAEWRLAAEERGRYGADTL
jgi:hypothetical protein